MFKSVYIYIYVKQMHLYMYNYIFPYYNLYCGLEMNVFPDQ